MAESRFLLKPGDVEYGLVCPDCAGLKCLQSRRCAACYYDARRSGQYPSPPHPGFGAAHHSWRGGTGHHKPRTGGASRGRPQPQTHPWRAANALLFRAREPEAVSPTEGMRPSVV